MHCYRLEKDKALKGFPASAFPIENAKVKKDLVEEAAVSLIIPKEIDVKIFHAELLECNTNCFQFGEVWLRMPKNKKPGNKLLVAVDWVDYWPDANLGDLSTLLTWKGTYALYGCEPDHTYIRNRTSGDIFTNVKGILTKVPGDRYDELRATYDRQTTIESVKRNNVLLDYIMD